MSLVVELALSALVVLSSVFVHGGGLLIIGRILAALERRARCDIRPLSWPSACVTAVVTVGLLLLSGLEIWGYALLFLLIGAIADLRDAVYYSTTTYAAIAAPDAVIAHSWRIAGAIEGINGLMLVGWSVAFFVTELQRLAHQGANRPVRISRQEHGAGGPSADRLAWTEFRPDRADGPVGCVGAGPLPAGPGPIASRAG